MRGAFRRTRCRLAHATLPRCGRRRRLHRHAARPGQGRHRPGDGHCRGYRRWRPHARAARVRYQARALRQGRRDWCAFGPHGAEGFAFAAGHVRASRLGLLSDHDRECDRVQPGRDSHGTRGGLCRLPAHRDEVLPGRRRSNRHDRRGQPAQVAAQDQGVRRCGCGDRNSGLLREGAGTRISGNRRASSFQF